MWMDLLFKRYASPFLLIEEMLRCGRFAEFVGEFLRMHNKDVEEQTLWDMYLHHSFLDKSFDRFKELIGVKPDTAEAKSGDFKTTVNNSVSILNSFVPED